MLSYIAISVVFALTSIIVLIFCTGRKKKDSITPIRYVKNNENDLESGPRSRASTNNGGNIPVGMDEKRISQHSASKENRSLPNPPLTNGDVPISVSPPSDKSGMQAASSVESFHRSTGSSPKKGTSRRLPALPPSQGDTPKEIHQNRKEDDFTYEDVRDDRNPKETPQTETVGSGDSSLYAKVPEDMQKRKDEDTDLYAQVGAAVEESQNVRVSTDKSARKSSSSSEDDENMDSSTVVTYASVDKMKKTMSVKRPRESSVSSASTSAPPVPERHFEEDEASESVQVQAEVFNPPPAELAQEIPAGASPNETISDVVQSSSEDQQRSPAYDTVSVRESLAHQRLRQMVEDEQRNRYVNTSQQPEGASLYSQIGEDNLEAVYESVSAPGSADGTVGETRIPNTSHPETNRGQSSREDGYSTISAVRNMNSSSVAPPPPPPNPIGPGSPSTSVNDRGMSPNYENIG